MLQKWIISGALLCAATAAYASQWEVFMRSDTVAFSYDHASVAHDGPVMRLWLRADYPKPTKLTPNGNLIDRYLTRVAVNCSTRQVATISGMGSLNDMPIEQENANPNSFSDIVPDSPVESLGTRLCRW